MGTVSARPVMDDPRHISSLQNPRVKEAVRLRQRSARDKTGLMLIEGRREIARALDNAHVPGTLFVCTNLLPAGLDDDLVRRCAEAGADLFTCTQAVFEKLSYREGPDGVLAVAPQLTCSPEALRLSANPLVMVAESLEKPGNLGAILRTADATAADAVIVCDRCTDICNPNVVRASMGTLFSVPVLELTSEAAIRWCREHGIRIVAADPHAERSYTQADMTQPTAIAVGTERDGLSEVWLAAADAAVRIPMKGQADSLNVSAAATLLLYEALRQRGKDGA